jgi:hypothetical protein
MLKEYALPAIVMFCALAALTGLVTFLVAPNVRVRRWAGVLALASVAILAPVVGLIALLALIS